MLIKNNNYYCISNLEGKSLNESVLHGARNRFRPVLMTALTDMFGFMPMVFSTGLGSEVQKPLAVVVVGGVISSTILTLLVLPIMYEYFYKFIKK